MSVKKEGISVRKFGKSGCRFYFVKPLSNCDSKSIGNRLIALDGVKEVHMTDGKYGFVIKSNSPESNCADSLTTRIRASMKSRIEVASSHYVYIKR
jgi:hypothetical protein